MKYQLWPKDFLVFALFTSILSLSVLTFAANKEITVLSIDSGTDLSHEFIRSHVDPKYWDSYDYFDYNSHGTHVAGIILKDTCPEVKFISCHYYDPFQESDERIYRYLSCLKKAVSLKPNVINISSGGGELQEELPLLKQLKNSIIVVAAGNNGKDLNHFGYYPARYNLPNLITVGNLTKEGLRNKTSNYGKLGMAWEIGTDIRSTLPEKQFGYKTGTSQATAVRTNRILKEKCRAIQLR